MSNALADALVSSITQGFDPMAKATSDLVNQHLRGAEETLNNARLDTMQRIQKLIDDGKANGTDGNVLDAYQKMLDKYTK